MRYVLIIALVLLVPALIAAVIALPVYFMVFYNKKDRDVSREVLRGPDYDPFHDEMVELIETAIRIPFEEVRIRAYDGLMLYGRVYLTRPGAPFHIQFNGYKGNGIRDFSGGLQLALSTGGNVLLVDQRAHGKSDGHTICYGVKERHDVVSWAQYVTERFGPETNIVLEGVSMGAATVLMASDLELPAGVRGIVADCPYSAPYDIIYKVARETVSYAPLARPFIGLAALLYGHFNLFGSTAERAVRRTKVPCLLIHGTGDNFVPVEMSRAIKAANPQAVTLVEVDGAPHGLSCLKDRPKYEAAVRAFYQAVGCEITEA